MITLLGDKRMGQQHTIGRTATTVRTINGWTEIQYHNTVVVKFNNKQIILNSGGWYTNTTKTRMNQASNQFDLSFWVSQVDFEWSVYFDGNDMPFVNGMIIQRK